MLVTGVIDEAGSRLSSLPDRRTLIISHPQQLSEMVTKIKEWYSCIYTTKLAKQSTVAKEIISKVAELDENGAARKDWLGNIIYNVNDHWFQLKAKFVWSDAPKREVPGGISDRSGTGGSGAVAPQPYRPQRRAGRGRQQVPRRGSLGPD